MPFLHVATLIKGREHDFLMTRRKGLSFPYFAFLDAEGEVIAPLYEEFTLDHFRAAGKRAAAYVTMRASLGATGDAAERLRLAVAGANAGALEWARVEELMATMDMTPELRLEPDRVRPRVIVAETMERVLRFRDPESQHDAVTEMLKLREDGKLPSEPRALRWFWRLAARHASVAADLPLLRSSVEALEPLVGDDERLAKGLERLRKRIEELEKDALEPTDGG